MTDSFPELGEILQTGNIPTDTSRFLEPCQRRLLDALRDSPKPADIASLVRHVLRREDERLRVTSQTLLKVPRRNYFPNRNLWQQAGITVLGEEKDYYWISANSWQPEWLDFSTEYPPDAPLCEEAIRRNYEPVRGDPFLDLVQLDAYRSLGQREAIHAILTAPPKSTLVVNLPTGAGKAFALNFLHF